jgi:hypothetical protein
VTASVSDELSRGMPTTVFVSDPSAEAEGIAELLRSKGYLVADVPLSMLVARVAVQRPRVLLVDADGEAALDTLARMRELPEADGIDVVFLGREGGAIRNVEDALARDGSGFFARPVDVPTLLTKIEALTGGPSAAAIARPSAPPPMSSIPPDGGRRSGSLPPPSMRDVSVSERERVSPIPRAPVSIPRMVAPPPPSLPSLAALVTAEKRPLGVQVSSELERLLAEAEQRIGGQVTHDSSFPSPEEEIEAVLSADVLASLDEPLEEEPYEAEGLGAHAKGTTSSGGPKATTGGGDIVTGAGLLRPLGGSSPPPPRLPTSEPPAIRTHHGGTNAGTTGGRSLTEHGTRAEVVQPFDDGREPSGNRRPSVGPPREPRDQMAQSRQVSGASGRGLGPAVPMPSVLAPGDAARVIAQAIVSRVTGVLCIESQDGTRRGVLREGDLVTAASSADSESLLGFLIARGDLTRDLVGHLLGRLPPFGRHAGAALVAHGHLRQDQLWSVLREHAEWVLGRMIQQSTGTATIEPDAPGRLRGEPSVFGGSTGAEVFVELVRRVVAPEDALARLGGLSSRIGEGPHARLFDECALDPTVGDLVRDAHGESIQVLVRRAPETDLASIVYALELLGIVEMVRAIGDTRGASSSSATSGKSSGDVFDEDAVRARVRARMQLIDEGDYFAVLGISRQATGYEVRRAFVDLRRAFEPSRILTPQIADLSQDVRKIASVLDEAYEILRDSARRDRYRRAIEG